MTGGANAVGATGTGEDDVTRGVVLGLKPLEAGLGGDVVIGTVVTTRGGSVEDGAGRAVEVAAEEGAMEDWAGVLTNTAEVRRPLVSAGEDDAVALLIERVGCGTVAVDSKGTVVALTVEDGIVSEASSGHVLLED